MVEQYFYSFDGPDNEIDLRILCQKRLLG